MTAAANGPLKGILDVNNEPLVSSDFNHTTVSSTFDATQTRVIKGEDGSVLVKVLAWYDNEWGYSCRMLDAARAWMGTPVIQLFRRPAPRGRFSFQSPKTTIMQVKNHRPRRRRQARVHPRRPQRAPGRRRQHHRRHPHPRLDPVHQVRPRRRRR
jgi:hypothetical protein